MEIVYDVIFLKIECYYKYKKEKNVNKINKYLYYYYVYVKCVF